jgi:hypothetical protein
MKTNKEQKAQQILINNLKKQLANKRDSYNDMIYRAAILEVAESKIPVLTNNNNFNYTNLPAV